MKHRPNTNRPLSDEDRLAQRIMDKLDGEATVDLMFDTVKIFARNYLDDPRYDDDIPGPIREAIEQHDAQLLREHLPYWAEERDEMLFQAEENDAPESVIEEYDDFSIIGRLLDFVGVNPMHERALSGFLELLGTLSENPLEPVEELLNQRQAK